MCDVIQFIRSTLRWIVSTSTRCIQGIGLGSLGGGVTRCVGPPVWRPQSRGQSAPDVQGTAGDLTLLLGLHPVELKFRTVLVMERLETEPGARTWHHL